MINIYKKPGFIQVLPQMKGFLAIYIIFVLIGLRIFYIIDVENKAADFNHIEQNFLFIQQQYIGYELQAVINDIGVMIGHEKSVNHENHTIDFKNEFDKELFLLCANRRNYQSAKIIDKNGKTVVYVECNSGKPDIKKIDILGTFPEDPLLTQVKALGPKTLYISDITGTQGSNKDSEIKEPFIRIAAALESQNQEAEKFIIIDYLIHDLTSSRNNGLMIFNITDQGGKLLLANNELNVFPFNGSFHDEAKPISDIVGQDAMVLFETNQNFIETKKYYINKVDLKPQEKVAEMLLRQNEQLFNAVSADTSLSWPLIAIIDKSELDFGFNIFIVKFLLFILFLSAIIIPLGFVFKRNRIQQGLYQQRLNEQRTFLITMMDSMSNAVIATNEDGKIQTINPSLTKILGYSTSDLLNQDAAPLLPTDLSGGRSNTSNWLNDHCTTNNKIEFDCMHSNGSWVPIELTISRSVDPNNPFFLLVIRDMTYRREVEKEMKNLHQKYIHREKLAEVGLLVGGILHEVSNPLAAINGLLSNLLHSDSEKDKPSLDTETRELFNVVFEHVERVRGLSYEVSSFLKPTSNEMALTDLNSVIHTTTSLIRFDHRWKDVKLNLKLDRNLPAIRAISDQLVQVVMNLLVNAADACSQLNDRSPEIELGTILENHMAKIYIQDNGVGMDDDTIRKIFHPFFTTKGDSGGTGLGLPLCEGIINDHGGHLEVTSEPGMGTKITCHLPIHRE